MGVLSQVKETMMKSLIVIALVAAVAQASVVETEFVQEGSAPSDDNFSAAQSRVESMLEMDTRARRSACVKAADASINNVFKEVQNAQRSLNRLDNGRRCASRNQHLINRAQHTIRLRRVSSTLPTRTSARPVVPVSVGTSPTSRSVRAPAPCSSALVPGRRPSVL